MITEATVAAPVKAHLIAGGWEVFEEVCLDPHLRKIHELGTARADIAATKGQRIMIVEVKVSLSFPVLAQARRWLPFVDEAWVAVPAGVLDDGRRLAFDVCRNYLGLGILEVDGDRVEPRVSVPRDHRRRDDALLVSLDPGHQTHAAAGTNQGGHFTPEKRTFAALAGYVAANPGCKLHEALELIDHHFRSKLTAERELTKKIRRDEVPDVWLGWRQGLWPTEESARTGVILGAAS